jgi:alcohol dehydrogenase
MRELHFLEPHKLAFVEAPEPAIIEPSDALVEPVAMTTCDLDCLIIRGEAPFRGPFAIGHECVARVIEVGEAVRLHRPGDLVVVHWHISCGDCPRCSDGRPNSCLSHQSGAMYGLPGLGNWGGTFSDRLRVVGADHALTAVPAGIDPVTIASAADNLPFAYEFTVPHIAATPRSEVLIMGGCGSIALYAVQFALAAGASRVLYHDRNQVRLDLASQFGAEVLDGPAPRALGQFPVVVDASADGNALRCALMSVEPEGIVSSVGGHFADLSIPLFAMYQRGVRFYTGRGRGGPNVPAALAWVAEGRVDPSLITSEIASFDDAPAILREPSLKPVLVRR